MDSFALVALQVAGEPAAMTTEDFRSYRVAHVPEDPTPPHYCRPKNYVGFNKPSHKDRTILECNDCGIFWWATVFTLGKGTYPEPYEHHIHWSQVRWYHFRLRKFTR
jgi:hypothetical protein